MDEVYSAMIDYLALRRDFQAVGHNTSYLDAIVSAGGLFEWNEPSRRDLQPVRNFLDDARKTLAYDFLENEN